MRKWQERRTREQNEMTVKNNKQRRGVREEYEIGGKQVGKYRYETKTPVITGKTEEKENTEIMHKRNDVNNEKLRE
jgi:hypothetical protein